MPTSNSRLAYPDIYELLDQRVMGAAGCRVEFPTEGKAKHFATRLNTARRIDRQYNATIYKPGDPLYGLSEYDKVSCKIRQVGGKWYCYLKEISMADFKVEDLPELGENEFFDLPEDPPAEPMPNPAWEEVKPQPQSATKAENRQWLEENREALTAALAPVVPTMRRRF